MANLLISNNRSRAERSLRPMPSNNPGEIYVVQWNRMEDETQGLARFINARVTAGAVAPGKVLVLAPSRKFGYAIRDALNVMGTPTHSFFHEESLDGNLKDREQCRAAETLSLLMLLVNPEDRVGPRPWCGYGSSSLRGPAWRRLRTYCESSRASPRAVLQALVAGSLTLPHCGDSARRCLELEVRLSQIISLSGIALVDAVFPKGEDWNEPFRAFAGSISSEEFEAKTLLNTLRVAITQPEMPTDVDYVRVMSLHKSKGLTADLVVIVGCIEGLIPRLTLIYQSMNNNGCTKNNVGYSMWLSLAPRRR